MTQNRNRTSRTPKAGPGIAPRLRAMAGFSAKVMAPILVLALGIVSFVGLKATKPEVPQRPVREKVWPVSAIEAKVTDFRPTIRLYGQTLSGRRVELRALVAGEIAGIGPGLKDGGVVSKGDLLLRIDPFKFEGAVTETKAQLAEARAKLKEIEANIRNEELALERTREQLQIARRDLERAMPLVEKGTVSRQTEDQRRLIVSERSQALELRESNLAVERARADQQRAIIEQAEWRTRDAGRNLDDTVLKAPFDAYVTNTSAEVGRVVSANDQVGVLLDQDWVEVRFALTDTQYGRIMRYDGAVIGRDVEVLWRVGDEPVRYKARVERVAAEISAESGGVNVYARIIDPKQPIAIRPGAFVEVLVPDRLYSAVVRLPQAALYDGDKVYVIDRERLAARSVELVGAARSDVLVRGELKPGESVMTTRLSKAEPGLLVREQ